MQSPPRPPRPSRFHRVLRLTCIVFSILSLSYLIDPSLVYADDELKITGDPITLMIGLATLDMQLEPASDQSTEVVYSTDASEGDRQIVARVADGFEIPEFVSVKVRLGDGPLLDLQDIWVILLDDIPPDTLETTAKLYIELSATVEAGVIALSLFEIEIKIIKEGEN